MLSPPGGGIDCHRTWEALYMGAIPIVRTSCLDKLFHNLPVVIVEKWEDVNEEFLIDQLQVIANKPLNMDKLSAWYWHNLIITLKEYYSYRETE